MYMYVHMYIRTSDSKSLQRSSDHLITGVLALNMILLILKRRHGISNAFSNANFAFENMFEMPSLPF